jgi:hypothetical protein
MRKGERWVQRLEVIAVVIAGIVLLIGYIISR